MKTSYKRKSAEPTAGEASSLMDWRSGRLTRPTCLSNWSGAVQGKFYRPVKQAVNLRLDADVIAWRLLDAGKPDAAGADAGGVGAAIGQQAVTHL